MVRRPQTFVSVVYDDGQITHKNPASQLLQFLTHCINNTDVLISETPPTVYYNNQ